MTEYELFSTFSNEKTKTKRELPQQNWIKKPARTRCGVPASPALCSLLYNVLTNRLPSNDLLKVVACVLVFGFWFCFVSFFTLR